MSCLGTSAGGCVQSALQPFARQKIVDCRQAELERGQAPGCRVRCLQLGHLRPQCVDLLCFAWVHSPQPDRQRQERIGNMRGQNGVARRRHCRWRVSR